MYFYDYKELFDHSEDKILERTDEKMKVWYGIGMI